MNPRKFSKSGLFIKVVVLEVYLRTPVPYIVRPFIGCSAGDKHCSGAVLEYLRF